MIVPALLLSIACGVLSSDIHHELPLGAAPVVTASSSQYFERTFNRLVAPPLDVFPVAPAPPVIIDAKRTTIIPVNPTSPPVAAPSDPNIAIAIATAHAAPVATFLLPPYPFGFPPSFGLTPQPSDTNFNKESTTPTTTTLETTTEREATTALPSNIDNSFAQALPSNENVNFKQYGLPLPLPVPRQKPQKLRTSVEIVPVPLAYIAPPPLNLHHHHGLHHGHHHQSLKLVPHIHTFIPKAAKIIIRPVSPRVRVVRVPAPYSRKSLQASRQPQSIRNRSRDVEETTVRTVNRPATRPPRL